MFRQWESGEGKNGVRVVRCVLMPLAVRGAAHLVVRGNGSYYRIGFGKGSLQMQKDGDDI